MKLLDLLIKIISWATVAGLIVLVLLRHCTAFAPPPWVTTWAVPVLTAAAVGYLTNWIAIWLLFKPYGRHFGFLQGVIPRNKARMGRELGEIIPEYLLKPDELADQLGTLVRDYLQNPELMTDIRAKVNLFLKKYSQDIADFLIPYIEDALKQAVRENVTPENIGLFYDEVVMKWLSAESNRKLIAAGIVGEMKNKAPEFTLLIRENVRSGAQEYVRTEYPKLSNWFNADEFAGKLVNSLNWNRIQTQITEKLEEDRTHAVISGELTALTIRLQTWIHSEKSTVWLTEFSQEQREKAERFLREYLAANIPNIVDRWLRKEELWDAVENQLLPLVQLFILHRLKQEKNAIIQKFDLPGKIESSVNSMNIAELHEMINRAAGEHLTVIQILGYILGAAAGFLLIFTT